MIVTGIILIQLSMIVNIRNLTKKLKMLQNQDFFEKHDYILTNNCAKISAVTGGKLQGRLNEGGFCCILDAILNVRSDENVGYKNELGRS